MGLTGQPRAIVVHEKKDREHCHVVWLRVNAETMTAIRADHNFRKHEIVARELEREFGHQRVQGAHIERDGKPRPERAPSHAEMQQAERTKIKPEEARAHITGLWRATKTGQEFEKALDDSGWKLARGDRRDFVVIDPKGGTHSLARRIDGATVKDVRARLADIDMKRLPSVAEARKAQYARHGRPEPVMKPKRRRAPSRTPAGRQTVRVIGSVVRPAAGAARGATRTTGGLLKGAGKAAGGIANIFESLLGGGASTPAKGRAKDDNKIPLDAGKVPPRAEIDEASHREHEAEIGAAAKIFAQAFARGAGRGAARRRHRARQERPRANAGGIGRPARGRRRTWGGSPARLRGGQGRRNRPSPPRRAGCGRSHLRPARVSRRRRAA